MKLKHFNRTQLQFGFWLLKQSQFTLSWRRFLEESLNTGSYENNGVLQTQLNECRKQYQDQFFKDIKK